MVVGALGTVSDELENNLKRNEMPHSSPMLQNIPVLGNASILRGVFSTS